MTTETTGGYTAIPNWLIEAMPRMTEAQFKVAVAVARRTIGWQKEADHISLSQFMADTGLKRAAVQDALHWLTGVGILTRSPAKRSSFAYVLTFQADIPSGRKVSTGSKFKPVHNSNQSSVRIVNQSEPQLVRISNTQKKEIYTTTNVVVTAAQEQATEVGAPPTEQLALIALPDTPASQVPPPAPERPKKPRQRKPAEPTPEILLSRALLAAWEQGPNAKNNARAARARDSLLEIDAAVSPERIELFRRRWFVKHSQPARLAAQRGEPVSPPTPEQVLGDWPRFRAWEEAERMAAERAQAEQERRRREAEEDRPATPEELRRIRDEIRRNWYNTAPAAPRPAMTARGRT